MSTIFDYVDRDKRQANPTRWEAAKQISPKEFHGDGYEEKFDRIRLRGQMARVYNLMSDGIFRTHTEIKNLIGGSENGIAAALRALRQKVWGSHIVNKRRRGTKSRGLWEYSLTINKETEDGGSNHESV